MPGLDGSRIQAPDTPDATPLQVQDLSSLNFFAAPAKAPENDQLGQLADSLGHFGQDVRQFGVYYSRAQRYQNAQNDKAEMQMAENLKANNTPEQWDRMVKGGTMQKFQSPMAQAFVDRTTGDYAARSLGTDIQSKLATGELSLSDGSAQKYAMDQRNTILQQPGWDQASGQARGFGDQFNKLWTNLGNKVAAQQATDFNAKVSTAADQQIENYVSDARVHNMTPEQFWSNASGLRKTLATAGHFEQNELDTKFAAAIMRHASEDPNWALQVGNAARPDVNGKDGATVPSLFSKPAMFDQANRLQQEAHAFNGRQEDATQKASINADVSTMLNTDSSRLYAVPDQIPYHNSVTGADGTVSKTTAVQAAVNSMVVTDNRRIASGQATPAQVQDEQIAKLAPAGIKQPQWADELNQGAKGGANFTSLTDPKQQGAVLKAYQLYQDLRTKNPAYLNSLAGDDARKLFGTAFMEQTIFNKSPVDAMQAASELSTADQKPEDAEKLRSTVDQAAVAKNWGGGWFSSGVTVRNPEIASDALREAATSLMRLHGMTAADAVEKATPFVHNAFVSVNGTLIPDMHYLPKEQMQPAAEKYLQDWAAGPAKSLNLDPKSLSLAPYGVGRYVVTDGASGLPITHGSGMSYVTAKDLIDTNRTMQQDAARQYEQGVQHQIDDARDRIRRHQEFLANPVKPSTDPAVYQDGSSVPGGS